MQHCQKEENRTCPICLSKVRNPAKPDTCTHHFCFNCLLQWSKIQNTCPVCKQKFKKVITLSPQPSKKKSKSPQTRSSVSQLREKYISDHCQEDIQEERMLSVLCGPGTRKNELAFLGLLCMLESVIEE